MRIFTFYGFIETKDERFCYFFWICIEITNYGL